jgi:hypothetical protein
MSDLRPDPEPPRRPRYDDLRDDYDDEFATRWTPFEVARRRVHGPGCAFLPIGILGLLGMAVAEVALVDVNLDRALAGNTRRLVNFLIGTSFVLVGVVLFSVVIVGGANMLHLRRRGLALFAAYVVTGLSLAGPYGIFFYPFGIWGLVVLYRPDVREQFGRAPPRDDGHGEL